MKRELEQGLQAALHTAFEQRVDALRSSMTERLGAVCRDVMGSAVDDARAHSAEMLSAAGRRIRSEESVSGIAAALVETTAYYCGCSALLIHKSNRLLGFQVQGLERKRSARFQRMDISVDDAAALARAIDTKDPVVTAGSVNELSETVAGILAVDPETRVHLFPLVLRGSVLALLYTDNRGCNGRPQTAAIELLVSLAEAWIEAVGTHGKATSAEERAAS